MKIRRLVRHLLYPNWMLRRAFPQNGLDAIEAAVRQSEVRHGGEIRFVVEAGLDLSHLLQGLDARQRAVALFAGLGVWDTEGNSGVLIYVQYLDRQVEIVADRGIAARVPQARWDALCRGMEAAFRERRFIDGSVAAIVQVGDILAVEFPASPRNPNELPDRPLLL